MRRFTLPFVAAREDIDELGHVNNTVWVRWVQELAVQHWAAVAPAEQQQAYIWVVTRHEIDYRGNIAQGQSVTAETFIPEGPIGARFDRRIDFRNDAGKAIVSARSTWAMLDKETLRLTRVSGEIAAAFAPEGGWPG